MEVCDQVASEETKINAIESKYCVSGYWMWKEPAETFSVTDAPNLARP